MHRIDESERPCERSPPARLTEGAAGGKRRNIIERRVTRPNRFDLPENREKPVRHYR